MNTFISLILSFSRCQNRKITFVFCVNFCFLMFSFMRFLIFLFLFCFFWLVIKQNHIDYQYITNNQQNIKKNIMLFSIALCCLASLQFHKCCYSNLHHALASEVISPKNTRYLKITIRHCDDSNYSLQWLRSIIAMFYFTYHILFF